ncbi:MAG: zeta toxin family protein [Polyangiaceae bacterium]|nr:zeta toxin family protein [Polyangiaceae bacterium]
MIVVAGPPGSGKTRYFPVTAFGVDAFNIDDRCAQILGSYRAIPRDVRRAVARECERFVLDHIEHRMSFAVETTLRTSVAIEQAELARKSGFATEMRFVATGSIAENVARVLQRAQAGGHGASEREIRAIHQASVANLPKVVSAFQRVLVYDSTLRWTPPRLVATARDGRVVLHGPAPTWLETALGAPGERPPR